MLFGGDKVSVVNNGHHFWREVGGVAYEYVAGPIQGAWENAKLAFDSDSPQTQEEIRALYGERYGDLLAGRQGNFPVHQGSVAGGPLAFVALNIGGTYSYFRDRIRVAGGAGNSSIGDRFEAGSQVLGNVLLMLPVLGMARGGGRSSSAPPAGRGGAPGGGGRPPVIRQAVAAFRRV